MERQERQQLVEELLDALESRNLTVDTSRLADLLRAEREAQDLLRVIRREIDAITNGLGDLPRLI